MASNAFGFVLTLAVLLGLVLLAAGNVPKEDSASFISVKDSNSSTCATSENQPCTGAGYGQCCGTDTCQTSSPEIPKTCKPCKVEGDTCNVHFSPYDCCRGFNCYHREVGAGFCSTCAPEGYMCNGDCCPGQGLDCVPLRKSHSTRITYVCKKAK